MSTDTPRDVSQAGGKSRDECLAGWEWARRCALYVPEPLYAFWERERQRQRQREAPHDKLH